MGGAAGGVGPALAQPGHQHVSGAGGDGQQRVVDPLAGIAVVAGALLGQSVGLADGGVQVNGQGPGAGSRPGLPSPGQQLAAHPVELTDVAPPEAAQEGAQGGWRLDRAAQGAGRPPGAQHIGVVNAVAPSQRRRHQRHHLVARVRPPRGIAQVEALPDEFGQAEVPRQGGRKEQPGIGHQAAVVEGDLDPVGVVAWQHLLGDPFPGLFFFRGRFFAIKPLSQKHRSTFLPPQDANPTPSFGGFGFSRSRDQDELHPHLLEDLADAALSGDSVVLYKSLGSFVGDHVAPRLESLEGTKEGIKSGTIDALTDLDDKGGIFLDETVTEVYYGGYRDGVSKGIDVIEGVELQEVEEARLLPSQDLFVRTRWGAWVTTTDDSHMPYFEEFEHWKASITVDLVMDQSSYKVKAMEEVAFDLEEPDWERY